MTTQVTIRAFEMKDWEDVAELFLAPKCQWQTLQMPYQSRDDIKKKLENPPQNFHRLVAELNDRQKVVGLIGLHTNDRRRAHVGELGMFVHDDYQNQGVGFQLLQALLDFADKWLNLKRIELTVFVDNSGAIHLYEKCSFVIEGTHKRYAFREGEYIDAHSMARVSEK